MSSKSRFDFKSIKVKLWLYFIGFAAVLIALIWFLQIFFLNHYYEEMKISETTKIANRIVSEYRQGGDQLASKIQNLAITNDIYVKVESGDGSILFSPESASGVPMFFYSLEVQTLKDRLLHTDLESVAVITPDKHTNTKTLGYACYLSTMDTGQMILYIFSPLYPMDSTVAILRKQLIYICIISTMLALGLALYLTNRLAKPIKDITNSAAEMGRGNYNVQFKGGHYTEIIELADTLNTASYELEKTEMYHKDLIANVSHDLRTPLTMIKSYAELIHDISGNNEEKRNTHLQVIIDETDRLNNLVSDMLNITRMQSKKVVLEKSVFDIKQAAESILVSYDILTEQEGYIFEFNCPKFVMVHADEAKMKQVLSNLINNAVKYCGEDKKVIINIKRLRNGRLRCEVADHGKGIAPEEITHVWERYYKSSTHHVRATEGSGLGLSIVKEILTLHKAEFGVTSKLGKGSTFWFELDVSRVKQTPPAKDDTTLPPLAPQNEPAE